MGKKAAVFLGFLIMGFVDIVGITTNYAKVDFGLRDSVANLLPLMVFVWFGLFSLSTGLLMNKIGRRNTVIAGLSISFVALIVPYFVYRFDVLLACFAGIGIGNMILQVALNPLLSNVITPARLTSALTAGQLIKSVASFMGPVLVGIASFRFANWRLIFPFFAFISLLNLVWLAGTNIKEVQQVGLSSSWLGCLKLLRRSALAILFVGVICIVGLDVGLNTTLPRLLIERCGISLERAGLGTSLYFFSRTAGSFIGIFLLAGSRNFDVFMYSVSLGFIGITGMLFFTNLTMLNISIVSTGLGVANIFPVLFSAAIKQVPDNENAVSGLMIMGVSGGAFLLPVMGVISDSNGQIAGMAILLIAWAYLFFAGFQIKKMGSPIIIIQSNNKTLV